MSFVEHAQAHGLMINYAIPDGKWHRVPTTDKPRKRNGAYVFDGHSGVVKNWATMDTFARYGEKVNQIIRYFDDTEERIKHARAAHQAMELIKKAILTNHPYLKAKGFPLMKGLVADEELIVPMRDYKTGKVTGAQRIKADGGKLFIPGSRAKGSVFVLGRGSESWLVEGYATGLSVQAALKLMYRPAQVVVCFSASNLCHVAERLGGRRFVVADHDESRTGERAAGASGLPWVMPEMVGDANDLHQSAGLMAVRSMLARLVLGKAGGQ
jgi:putative DNA primase/helicase